MVAQRYPDLQGKRSDLSLLTPRGGLVLSGSCRHWTAVSRSTLPGVRTGERRPAGTLLSGEGRSLPGSFPSFPATALPSPQLPGSRRRAEGPINVNH